MPLAARAVIASATSVFIRHPFLRCTAPVTGTRLVLGGRRADQYAIPLPREWPSLVSAHAHHLHRRGRDEASRGRPVMSRLCHRDGLGIGIFCDSEPSADACPRGCNPNRYRGRVYLPTWSSG